MYEEELLQIFYDAYNQKTRRGKIYKTFLGSGRTVILDKVIEKVKEYRENYSQEQVAAVLKNVGDAIRESGDKEAYWFWGGF